MTRLPQTFRFQFHRVQCATQNNEEKKRCSSSQLMTAIEIARKCILTHCRVGHNVGNVYTGPRRLGHEQLAISFNKKSSSFFPLFLPFFFCSLHSLSSRSSTSTVCTFFFCNIRNKVAAKFIRLVFVGQSRGPVMTDMSGMRSSKKMFCYAMCGN